LVVVLSADIGRSFSAQDGIRPEEQALLTVRFHAALQGILSRYGGECERLVGSSVLALFGKTQTRESDPELAVRAAVEARQKAQSLGLVLTAGVATGEIYTGAGGQAREHALVGSAIDRALSLASEARPGQILAGETTYRLTQRAFEWHALATGIAGTDPPADLYQVGDLLLCPQKARGIEGLRAELIGRDAELSRLEDALAQVLLGRGQMVSLIGEAGVGKSRLVAELKQVAFPDAGQESNLLWLEGRCLDLGTAPSYAPFVDMLHALWGWGAREAELRRYERLTQFLTEMVEQKTLGQQRAGELAALLGRLLSLPIGPEWEAELESEDPGQLRARTFLALCDLIRALGRRQPVVLVFEDLH
jgi:adenylate cyclase